MASQSGFKLSEKHKQFLPILRPHRNHPLWPHGTAYVVKYDHRNLTWEERKDHKTWEEALKVPSCLDDKILQQRLTLLEWGDAIFVRVTADPRDDILVVCVAPEWLVKRWRKELKEVTELVLGNASECGPKAPVWTETIGSDGIVRKALNGGIAFERVLGRNHHNGQGGRCYTNAISAEQGAQTIGPTASLTRDSKEAVTMRTRINLVSILSSPSLSSRVLTAGSGTDHITDPYFGHRNTHSSSPSPNT